MNNSEILSSLNKIGFYFLKENKIIMSCGKARSILVPFPFQSQNTETVPNTKYRQF